MQIRDLKRTINFSGLKNLSGYFLLLGSFFLLLRILLFCFSNDLWYDEVFSVGFLRHSYGEILQLTAADVHPPFYYWYLKLFVSLGTFLFPALSEIMFAKLASWFPFALLWLLSITVLRKKTGALCSGTFSFCVLGMPQLSAYSVEIRMYSLALLLITLAFLCSLHVFKTDSRIAYGGLFFCGILTAYTQYFSCIAIGVLYLLLLFFLIVNNRNKGKWLLCVILSVASYLPWLPVFIRQFTSVGSSYWIPPLSWRSFLGAVKYIYLPLGGYPVLNYLLAGLMIAVTFLFLIIFFLKKWKEGITFDEDLFFIISGFGLTAGVILIGVTLSLLISPIFVYRYMIPTLGVFWLTFAFLLSKYGGQLLPLLTLLLTIYVGSVNVRGFFWEEGQKQAQMEAANTALETLKPEDILIFNFNHPQAVVGSYVSNPSYLLFQEAEPLIQTLYGDYGTLSDSKEIKELLENGHSVKFLGSFEAREDLVKEWEQEGIFSQLEGSYLLERYWLNFYSLSLNRAESF